MLYGIDTVIAGLLREQKLDRALQEILSAFGPELRGYLRGTLGSEADGDDVFQEVCAAIWEGLPRFQQHSSVRTWTYAIAHHRTAKKLRRFSRRKIVRLDTAQQEGIKDPSLTSLIEHERRRQQLTLARECLSPSEREILILRSERGLEFREISAILDVAEESCRKRFQRAKDHLKELLQSLDRRDGTS